MEFWAQKFHHCSTVNRQRQGGKIKTSHRQNIKITDPFIFLKNPQRSEAQNMLNWFLDAASGFYLTLIGEVCSQFHLDLPFRR
jgi:hypothetical protein